MDEQKRIDECNKIADIIPSVLEIEDEEDFYISRLKRCMIALYLLDAGYGDVKQAVIKYADKLALHIAGHSNYHGDNILSAIYVLAEGRDIKDVQPLNLEKIRKQAVREFVERLKQFLDGAEIYFYNGEEEGIWDSGAFAEQIDKLVKEVCGE